MKTYFAVAALLSVIDAKHKKHVILDDEEEDPSLLAVDLKRFEHFLAQKEKPKHHHSLHQQEAQAAVTVEAEEQQDEAESSSTDHEHRAKRLRNNKHVTHVNIYQPVKRAYQNKPDNTMIRGYKKKPRAQTTESLIKAAEDAKHTANALNARGKELGAIAKEKKQIYDTKQAAANDAAREVSDAASKARELKARLTRSIRRLETIRHEAVHDAHRNAKSEVEKQKAAHAELKEIAKEEAEKAASAAGASATLAINSAASAERAHGLVQKDDDQTSDEE